MTNTEALLRQVAIVRQRFPWYDERVRASGFDADPRLVRLPLVDEAMLDSHYYQAELPAWEGAVSYFTSGTSSGRRKRLVWDALDDAAYLAQRTRIFSAFVASTDRVGCSDLGTGHAAQSATEIFRRLGLEAVSIDFQRPVGEHVEALNRIQPDVFFTMPMILDRLVLHGGLTARPRRIAVVGDVASAAWKLRMREYFGLEPAALLDVYGSMEAGAIAFDCGRCGRYHIDTHILPEVLDARDFGASSPGSLLVVTSLTRAAFPALRYVTGDLVEDFHPIVCGDFSGPSFARILGRLGNELKHGEKISLYEISTAVNEVLPAARFEIYKDAHQLVIQVASPAFDADAAARIKARLRALAPDIDQMIQSGLVADIAVVPMPADPAGGALVKQRFHKLTSERG